MKKSCVFSSKKLRRVTNVQVGTYLIHVDLVRRNRRYESPRWHVGKKSGCSRVGALAAESEYTIHRRSSDLIVQCACVLLCSTFSSWYHLKIDQHVWWVLFPYSLIAIFFLNPHRKGEKFHNFFLSEHFEYTWPCNLIVLSGVAGNWNWD